MGHISIDQFTEGLNRIIIGMAKKLIFADYFGAVLVTIPATGIDQITAALTIIIYSLQLLFDFAGYSDMAIGFGMLFGYQLPENFHYPYLSTSITEFWRRWHMSLGRFFREYLYIPLGGNRKGKFRTLLNLMLVFIATGIWHGAGWNYIIWGSMHSICVVGERVVREQKWTKHIPKVLKWLYTLAVVFVGWQFFRYNSLGDVYQLFKQVVFIPDGMISLSWQYYFTKKLAILSIMAFFGASFLGCNRIQNFINHIKEYKWFYILKQILMVVLFILAIICMVSSTYSPFIYFSY